MGGLATLALGAGLLAALNPCGFALLPAYLGLLMAGGGTPRSAVRRALRTTLAMTAGFVGVFALFGLLLLPISTAVEEYLPWVSVALGLVLLAAGGWMLAGRTVPAIALPGLGSTRRSGTGSMAVFGASYALASLSCTIAPFLAVVVFAFRSGSVAAGLGYFVLYAFGMALVVGTAAVGVSLARAGLVGRLRGLSRHVPRISGLLLLVSGGYSLYYGIWEVRVLAGGPTDDPVVARAGRLRSTLAGAVQTIGAPGLLAVLAALAAVALVAHSLRPRLRSAPHRSSTPPGHRGIVDTDRSS
jgi:cytochrome c-type biogenesis protein